jgi:hypothetical protein
MSGEPLALSVEAIQEDLLALACWRQREPVMIQPPLLSVRERGGLGGTAPVPPSDLAGVGRQLLRRCGFDTEQRLVTLLHLERSLRAEHDHGALVVWASQLVESVLVRLLAEPLRPRADHLIQALRVHRKDAGAAEALARWSAGQMPTTLGTLVNILLALRRAAELDLTELRQVVAQWFTPRYLELLRGSDLARALNQVRDRYRNPAAHGLRTFDAPEYEAFAQLVVARARFAAWDLWGPEPPEPPAHEGVFHHHVAGYRGPSGVPPLTTPTPLSQLLALQPSPTSAVRVQVHVAAEGQSRTREVRFGERAPTFHLGMTLAIHFQAEPDAYGLLLDVGTGGSVAVLWPNRWDPHGRLEAGRPAQIPGPLCPLPLILQGATSEERLIALAALDPWPQDWRPAADEAFRELTSAEVAGLLEHLQTRDPQHWAVDSIAFRVEL